MDLATQYDISILPLNIVLGEHSFQDGEEISPDEIYRWADAHATTPKTAAPNLERAVELLRPFAAQGRPVVCFGISGEMSSSCQVMRLAAHTLECSCIYVIDSQNLSTGIGLQVLKAAELAQAGKSAEEIVRVIEAGRPRVRASFVVDTLTYLHRGGRCGAVTALVGNALRLKPKIEVLNGRMSVARKYRGSRAQVVLAYVRDLREQLLQAECGHVFITHSGIEEEVLASVRAYLESLRRFRHIHITRAGGVVSSHCGKGTLGVLYYLEETQ